MAIAFVQSDSDTTFGGTSFALAYPSNNTAGSLLICSFAMQDVAVPSVGDSNGNSWNLAKRIVQASNIRNECWYAENCNSGANTVTITFGGDVAFSDIKLHEYSGVATSSSLDAAASVSQNQVNPGTGTNAVSSSSGTPSTNGSLIFGATTPYSGSTTTSAGTNFNVRENPFTDSPSEDLVQTSAASIAATFTQTDSSADFITLMAVFKPVAAAGRTTKNTRAWNLGSNVGMGWRM